jgi:putative membrane protein
VQQPMHDNSHRLHHHGDISSGADLLASQGVLIVFFVFLLFIYPAAALFGKRKWPNYKIWLWIAGTLCCLAAMGPLASSSHHNFSAHMLGHLLLGMLGPLLMVLSAPVTLALRTMPVSSARKTASLLKSRFFRYVSNPAAASLLNIGGLWLLYTTGLFQLMHQYPLLYLLIHLHVFLSGYLFAASFISLDPSPHRWSFFPRAAVLVTALAGHGILSKFLYVSPPAGVSLDQSRDGAVLMYYGGDLIDLVIIIFFCLQWYKAKRPREAEVRTAAL